MSLDRNEVRFIHKMEVVCNIISLVAVCSLVALLFCGGFIVAIGYASGSIVVLRVFIILAFISVIVPCVLYIRAEIPAIIERTEGDIRIREGLRKINSRKKRGTLEILIEIFGSLVRFAFLYLEYVVIPMVVVGVVMYAVIILGVGVSVVNILCLVFFIILNCIAVPVIFNVM